MMSAEPYTKKIGSSRSSLLFIGIAVAVAIVGAIALLRSGGAEIEVIRPARGEIRESFREPARTRLENTWTITAQVSGRIGRIDLEPGDTVEKGQILAEFDRLPFESTLAEAEARIGRLSAQLVLLEDSSVERAELAAAEARARSSEDRILAAEARIEAAKARVLRTQKDLARSRELVEVGALDPQSLDRQEMETTEAVEMLKQAEAELDAQRSDAVSAQSTAEVIEKQISRKELDRRQILAQIREAEAQRDTARHNLNLAAIRAPIGGVVLERLERGEKPVLEGTPLLVLGNPSEIEVIADVLTEDALKLQIGDEVGLEKLSGERFLDGRVKLIEPQGFTKLSSLGVEQQRINVIVTIDDPPADLGVGYRLHARFFTGTRTGTLVVPRYTVLQSPDQSYYVFVIEDGTLRKRPVTPGLKSDLTVEILEGVEESTQVVASPDSTLVEGTDVKPVDQDFRP